MRVVGSRDLMLFGSPNEHSVMIVLCGENLPVRRRRSDDIYFAWMHDDMLHFEVRVLLGFFIVE